MVLKKPAGIAVESARVTETDLVSALRSYTEESYLVHRLDQVVEGAMVFAKTKQAAAALSKQLTGAEMTKEYLAKVCGPIPKEADTLVDYLIRDGKHNVSRVTAPPKKGSHSPNGPKRAELRYRKESEEVVRVELVTGRHHQIRVQLSHAGMPIAGDRKYGAPPESCVGLARGQIALTAVTLSFLHPKTGERMVFQVTPAWLKS